MVKGVWEQIRPSFGASRQAGAMPLLSPSTPDTVTIIVVVVTIIDHLPSPQEAARWSLAVPTSPVFYPCTSGFETNSSQRRLASEGD